MHRSSSGTSATSLSNKSDVVGADNPSYARSASDHQLPSLSEDESSEVKFAPRNTSSSAASFPVIYEVQNSANGESRGGISFGQPSSSSNQTTRRRSAAVGPHERQLSILDPTSDRVSTILTWQNLSVVAREDRMKEFCQKIKSYKNFEPKRKCLLSNTTGVIAGGLWAVMGELPLLLLLTRGSCMSVYRYR